MLDRDGLLVSDSNPSYHYFAKEQGITREAVTLKSGVRVRGAFHVQNVSAYHRRLRGWMERFHGVATFYLPNYLGWRRALDTHRLNTPVDLLLAAAGAFPHLTRTEPFFSSSITQLETPEQVLAKVFWVANTKNGVFVRSSMRRAQWE